VNIDGFDALGGQGMLFSSVRPMKDAGVGSVTVDYPRNGDPGRGPILLSFEAFDQGGCAAFEAAASSWNEGIVQARVMDTVGARIQVVFDSGLRGSGVMVLCGSNGSVGGDVPCDPGDGVALISESRTVHVRLPR
jgi:hypothetical protein